MAWVSCQTLRSRQWVASAEPQGLEFDTTSGGALAASLRALQADPAAARPAEVLQLLFTKPMQAGCDCMVHVCFPAELGVSQRAARASCSRLVTAHNPIAVSLHYVGRHYFAL